MIFAVKMASALVQTVVAVIAWKWTPRGTLFGRVWPPVAATLAVWMWARAYSATKED